MSIGKAEKRISSFVDFFDWNRYNITQTTELANWTSSFGQDVNKFFKVDGDNKQLFITTVIGEDVPVSPGDVILRDKDGNYFKTSPSAFVKNYEVTEENGAKCTS